MPSVSLYCKVHLPFGLNHYEPVEGPEESYFNNAANEQAVNHLSDECYLPANKIIARLIAKHEGKFRIAFSISGTTLELLQRYRPDVISSFQQLAKTGGVEFLSETYYSSLSWLHSKNEFKLQVEKHAGLIKKLFGQSPVVFRNTELIYNNELAVFIAEMGYKGIICEGLDRILQGRDGNQTYYAPGAGNLGVLLRHVNLSDDIAFRFGSPYWSEFPLTAEKYAGWIHTHTNACNINILLDYETFGIYKKTDTGIFEFLEYLPAAILSDDKWRFTTPSEALLACLPKDEYNAEETISWKGKEIKSCVWCENTYQNNMLKKVYSLEKMVHKNGTDLELDQWRKLQSADHFYYMADDNRTADDTYQYLNPFTSAEEAYKSYMHIITGFEIKLIETGLSKFKGEKSYSSDSPIF